MAATPERVREVINQYVQAWTHHDRELLLSLFAEDATWADPVGTPEFVGHQGIAQFWDFAHQDSSRQLTPKPEQIIACANEGILRFIMQVRLPEEGKGLDLYVTDHFVLDDSGKIKSARAFWDESCVSCPPGLELFIPDVSDAHQ